MEFFKCETCGNVVIKEVNGGGELVCCGHPMTKLEAGVTDAAVEKHVPAVKLDGNIIKVQIGSVEHPMTQEHFIQFILVEQGDNIQYKRLHPDVKPVAEFKIDPQRPYVVYEYCNLHGLWKTECEMDDETVCAMEFTDGCKPNKHD